MSSAKRPAAPTIETLARVLIVGLGNPGRRYSDTRHNIGFWVVDELARRHGVSLTSKRYQGEFGEGRIGAARAALLKPQTYMNRSGHSVAEALRYMWDSRETEPPLAGGLVVIHDDVDLALGRLRLKWAGGNAGHNGLRSLDACLGSPEYFRIRVGVGRPRSGAVRDHVLSRFGGSDRDRVTDVVEGGADAVERLLREGLVPTQNDFHGRTFGPEPPAPEQRAVDEV